VARGGGFAFLSIPSSRWFSRQPLGFNAPGRTIARYDVRASGSSDDAQRSDLTREIKQALAYAEIASALAGKEPSPLLQLADAMRSAVNELVALAGYRYEGLEPASFEPQFEAPSGRRVGFDLLPNKLRHLVCFAALPVRLLWAAHPERDPRRSEAVVAIDEVDLQLEPALASELLPALCRSLPGVQWILSTASSGLASAVDARELLALRRVPGSESVELFTGEEARVH
jgi:hypothetical protein